MLSPYRLVKVAYLLVLCLAVFLLLGSARSPAQFRGTPANFVLTNLTFPVIGQLPNHGRIVGLPPPPMMLPLNNMMFGLQYMDSTGSPIAIITSMPGGMGGGMMGMMGMGGGMMGMSGGGMMGMGGGMMGMGGGMGGMGGGMMGMGGGMTGMGGMMGMGGMSMMGMGGMSGGGMMGFAGKGMGGFNGRKAL